MEENKFIYDVVAVDNYDQWRISTSDAGAMQAGVLYPVGAHCTRVWKSAKVR